MALRVDAAGFQEKHARRLKASLEDVKKGIDRVTVSPGKLAAAKVDKMKAKLDEAFSSGKVKRALENVSLDSWKKDMLEKGVGRISGGIDRAKDKTIAFAEKLLPAVEAARNKVKAMPDLTIDDSIARATSFIKDMSKFKYK